MEYQSHEFSDLLTGHQQRFDRYIVSPYALFAIHDESHQNLTFKMDQAGWIDIIRLSNPILRKSFVDDVKTRCPFAPWMRRR